MTVRTDMNAAPSNDVPSRTHPVRWPPGLRSWIWRSYISYARRFPFDRGKWRLGRILDSTIGPASVRVRGLELELRPTAYIDGLLLERGSYEREIEILIEEKLGPGDVFVDVGANIGWYSVLGARTGATVFAFEPLPQNAERLERHRTLNSCANLHLRRVALGASEETLSLRVAEEENPGATSFRKSYRGVGRIEVPVRTLATELGNVDPRSIKLVKIDVEGWELEVLRGATGLLPDLEHATLVVEVTPTWLRDAGGSAEELYELLRSVGFAETIGVLDELQYTEVFRRFGAAAGT
jgi:FkbM family methyltransferase